MAIGWPPTSEQRSFYSCAASTTGEAVKVAPRHTTVSGLILVISSPRQPRACRYSIKASAGDHAFRTQTARLPE